LLRLRFSALDGASSTRAETAPARAAAVLSGGAPGDTDDVAERAIGVALAVAAGLTVLVLATGHVSALVFGGGWPRYPVSAVPGILGRFVTDPLDPPAAWEPVNDGAPVPGAPAWWATLALAGAAVAAAAVAMRRRATRRARVGAAAVRARDVRRRQLTRSLPTDLVVGAAAGQEVAIRDRRSLLVLGPRRSGKTSAVAVPAVLEWPGPVVATCTGDDLVTHTIGWRSRLGDVHVYDPARVTRHHPSGWSPLASCHTWDGAERTAWNLVMGAKASIGTASGVGDMWFNSTPRSLAPYLLAAASSGRSMADVARWVDTEDHDEAMAVVRSLEPDAAVALGATFRRDAAVRASLFHVMGRVVGAYADPTVAASARDHEVEPAELLDGDPHTLYVVGPHHDQARLRPLNATLVRQVLTAAHARVERTRRPLDAPLLLLLDDATDVGPVADLATQAASAAAAGVQVVTVIRDLAQLQVRHGPDAARVLANHRAKLLLPGVAGGDDLGPVPGEVLDEIAASADGDGRADGDGGEGHGGPDAASGNGGPTAGRSAGAPAIGTALAADLDTGEALLLVDAQEPLRLRLRPWFRSRALRRRAGAQQDALLPHDPADVNALSPFGNGPATDDLDLGPGDDPEGDGDTDRRPGGPLFPVRPPAPERPKVAELDAARARRRRTEAAGEG
jgi:type IV secretion system protein VirD4